MIAIGWAIVWIGTGELYCDGPTEVKKIYYLRLQYGYANTTHVILRDAMIYQCNNFNGGLGKLLQFRALIDFSFLWAYVFIQSTNSILVLLPILLINDDPWDFDKQVLYFDLKEMGR